MQTPRQKKALALLAAKRKAKPNLKSECFPKQLDFINDPARFKAALCTRRAGKSYGVGVLAIDTALTHSGVKIVIIGKTNQSIRGIYFDDVMAHLGRKYKINWKLNRTEMIYRLENGSQIMFIGADADADQMNKLLGQKFKLAILDEASMYANIDLRTLVYGIIRPALSDLSGSMVLIGTPSDYLNSLYYDITTGKEAGWAVHKWTANDNPHMVRQIAEDELLYDQMPGYRESTLYKQHNLGLWVVDDGKKVYKFNDKINHKPAAITNQYQHVMGVDLGFEDDSAFVVGAWSHYDTTMHIVHVETHKHMLMDDVENKIKQLQSRFNVGTITMDSAGKNFVETLQTRFQTAIHKAEKIHKKDFIELMNTDFQMGRINLLPGTADALIKEYNNLVWDEDKLDRDPQTKVIRGKWLEARSCSNHAADAALYMWRWCYNYAAIPKTKPPTYEETLEQQLVDKIEQKDNDTIQFSNSDFSW